METTHGQDRHPEWIEFADAAARAGVTEATVARALADGELAYSTRLPGHEGVPMLRLADVCALAEPPVAGG